MLRQACLKGAELREQLPHKLRISVNLSVKQLQSDSIIDEVREILEETGLEPSSLVLEVTETVMLADADMAVQRLHGLKNLGVLIAMDDFGTGYSSLSYLSRLPVDILKMDRSFLTGGIDDRGLAAAIMAIGERLGLEVVAEGIERATRSVRSRTSASSSARASCSVGRCRRASSTRTSSAPPRSGCSTMQHSFEGLDRAGGVGRVGLLRPLRRRDFRRLWVGMSVSLVGDGVFLVATAWTAYAALERAGRALDHRDRPDRADDGVPAARRRRQRPLRPPSRDAVGRRRAATLGVGAPRGPGAPARADVLRRSSPGSPPTRSVPDSSRRRSRSSVPSLVPADELPQANALDQFVRPIALRLVGPALGGVLVGVLGAGTAFALDAASFAFCALAGR